MYCNGEAFAGIVATGIPSRVTAYEVIGPVPASKGSVHDTTAVVPGPSATVGPAGARGARGSDRRVMRRPSPCEARPPTNQIPPWAVTNELGGTDSPTPPSIVGSKRTMCPVAGSTVVNTLRDWNELSGTLVPT